MSLTHDIIKMKYVEEGYLPNYPFHMISDSEMCDAFLKAANVPLEENEPFIADDTVTSYFLDTYPCVDDSLGSSYNQLIDSILWHIDQLKRSTEDEYTLPDWVYSYMLGVVIGPESEILDIHDLLVLMNLDNIDDIFTLEASKLCLKISTNWVARFPLDTRKHRNPTIFGEPHVIKYLRLADSVNT